MGARLAGAVCAAAVGAAAILLTMASPALAAPPACDTPPPQQVVTGDILFIESPCTDADADVLTYVVTTNPMHGTVDVGGEDLFYTPTPPYTGPDSFAFTASDGTDTTAPVAVSITVVENQPPECPASIDLTVEPGEATSFNPWLDCTDDQFFFLFDILQPPQHGTLTEYDFDSGFTYEPAPGYSGSDSFMIQADDTLNTSDPITVNVTVLPPNRLPHCVTPVTVRVPVGGSVPLDYRTTCSDPDGDPIFPELVTGPAHGLLDLTLPTVTYRPAAGFQGTDIVRYRVSDDRGGESNVATVTLIVGTVVGPSPPDVTAPALAITKTGSHKLRTIRKKGVRLQFTASEPGTLNIALSVSKRTARTLGINRKAKRRVVIGRASKPVVAGRNTITIKLTKKARRAFARARSVKVLITMRVVDAAGNRATKALNLRLKR